jgi:hypothetical protein
MPIMATVFAERSTVSQRVTSSQKTAQGNDQVSRMPANHADAELDSSR